MSTFEQGWAGKPFKEQFPQLSDDQAKKLDDINRAIALLHIHGIITASQNRAIRDKKMVEAVKKELRKASCVDCHMPISNCCCG